MTSALDYGKEQPRSRVVALLVRIIVILAILFVSYVSLIIAVMSPWGRALTTPSVHTLIKKETGVDLPTSFVQTNRQIYGGLDPAGHFAGKATPADAAALVSALERSFAVTDISKESVHPLESPPPWWSPASWSTRRSFTSGPPNPTAIHVNPQTGDIAIEWITT